MAWVWALLDAPVLADAPKGTRFFQVGEALQQRDQVLDQVAGALWARLIGGQVALRPLLEQVGRAVG